MRLVRQVAAWAPWVVEMGFLALWAGNGFLAGFPLFLVLGLAWTLVLGAMRRTVTSQTGRGRRAALDVVFGAIAFVFGWEGGIAILPALFAFLIADLIDPTTPAFPVVIPPGLVRAALVGFGLVLVVSAFTMPLSSSATATVGPDGSIVDSPIKTYTFVQILLGLPPAVLFLTVVGLAAFFLWDRGATPR